jgi:hypothetical protein
MVTLGALAPMNLFCFGIDDRAQRRICFIISRAYWSLSPMKGSVMLRRRLWKVLEYVHLLNCVWISREIAYPYQGA